MIRMEPNSHENENIEEKNDEEGTPLSKSFDLKAPFSQCVVNCKKCIYFENILEVFK